MTEHTNKRKLVTIRQIDALDPIVGRDLIEVATIEGWKVVVKKGEFKVGDLCVYFEIDSFLSDGNPAWQFLVDKSSRLFEGKKGHKLRTVRLGGQVSQGLALPLSALPQIETAIAFERLNWSKSEVVGRESFNAFLRSKDFSELLGVVKWEAPFSPELAGLVEGVFPSFIKKTDQERCNNLKSEIFGELADPTARYEISMKLDGSSMTVFHRDGETGVCSRNLQLKICDENASNSFVRMAVDSGLMAAMPQLGNVAIQGELMGPGIQGNRERFNDFRFYVFDVFLIDEGRYATPEERKAVFDQLFVLGVNPEKVFHVPVLHSAVTLQEIEVSSVEDLLKIAEGPSINHKIREGLVFKRLDGQFSFKAISEKFLLGEAD